MKKCPFCAEEIQEEAIKCKHCGTMLVDKAKEKWYFKASVLVVAFLSVGPLALLLIWLHPRYSKKTKVIISVSIIILTYVLGVMLSNSLKSITGYYKAILQ